MSRLTASNQAQDLFPHTRWSLVLAATRRDGVESGPALEAICAAYWPPLYAYVRRCGQSPHDAQDLTQEFFRHLLEKGWLDSADPDKGRLRTFLIVMLKRFMSKEWRRASAQRRGGEQIHVPFDTALAESRYAADQSRLLAPDETFDRQWALTLLDLAVERLRQEFLAAGKPAEFGALKDCLMAARGAIAYAEIAKRLGINEGAARVAAHRLRRRFREIFREAVAHTLADGTEVEAEMRHLAAALAHA
jgi:RNA polymerase sigma-70 factor (ECF subfamily)